MLGQEMGAGKFGGISAALARAVGVGEYPHHPELVAGVLHHVQRVELSCTLGSQVSQLPDSAASCQFREQVAQVGGLGADSCQTGQPPDLCFLVCVMDSPKNNTV